MTHLQGLATLNRRPGALMAIDRDDERVESTSTTIGAVCHLPIASLVCQDLRRSYRAAPASPTPLAQTPPPGPDSDLMLTCFRPIQT